MFGLTDRDWSIIDRLAIRPLKEQGARVWIFGSRACGNPRPYSDIDLLFEREPAGSLPAAFLSGIRESLEESRLPVKVDLVDVRNLTKSYRDSVLALRVPL